MFHHLLINSSAYRLIITTTLVRDEHSWREMAPIHNVGMYMNMNELN